MSRLARRVRRNGLPPSRFVGAAAHATRLTHWKDNASWRISPRRYRSSVARSRAATVRSPSSRIDERTTAAGGTTDSARRCSSKRSAGNRLAAATRTSASPAASRTHWAVVPAVRVIRAELLGKPQPRERSAGVSTTHVRNDAELERRHRGQVHTMVFRLEGRALRAEVPLLPDDFAIRRSTIR